MFTYTVDQHAGQVQVQQEGYLSDPRVLYCAEPGTSLTLEERWKVGTGNPSGVGYPYWINYRTKQNNVTNDALPDLIVETSRSDPDLVMLSDATTWNAAQLNWYSWGNHAIGGEPVGGNVALHDGSVQWRRFGEMQKRLIRAALQFYF